MNNGAAYLWDGLSATANRSPAIKS